MKYLVAVLVTFVVFLASSSCGFALAVYYYTGQPFAPKERVASIAPVHAHDEDDLIDGPETATPDWLVKALGDSEDYAVQRDADERLKEIK